MKQHILTESVYLNGNGKGIAPKDAQHKILLGHAGQAIPHETAKLLGLLDAEKKESTPAEDKAVAPAENKASAPAKTKAAKGKGK